MSTSTTLHHFALLDKTGKTRGTCEANSAPKPCPLDPQAEKLLEEAKELLAAVRRATGVSEADGPDLVAVVRGIASTMDRFREMLHEANRKQDHTDALLVKALDERDTATREARALNATVDNLTANLSRANTEINRLNAMLAKAQEARDAHRKALGLAEQDGTILDAINRLKEDLVEAREALAKAEGDATSLLFLLAQIREALGDNGKRMQDELLDYCRDLRRSKDAIQAALGNGADEDAWRPGEHWADAAARKIRAARETQCTQ